MTSNGYLLSFSAANAGRRKFFGVAGATLSAPTFALLAGCESFAAQDKTARVALDTDIGILNGALSAEREAIAAYQLGADSGLLTKDIRAVAIKFQGHHKAHADLLAATVSKLGGVPATEQAHYDFPVSDLHNQTDVLRFAASLESGAVSAYVSAVPKFGNRDLAGAAASILGDEAMHWAILRHALGEDPVPAAFVG